MLGGTTMIGYQVMTGKFAPTFRETADKIDYLLDLGVSHVWFTPWVPSPSYHGYDATDYYSVKSDYGTMEDFEYMVQEFHKNGLKVIMDLVICHTSDQHEWFRDSKTRDKYYFIEKEKPSDNYLPDPKFGNCWSSSCTTKNDSVFYYRAPFWGGMPALNLDNQELRKEIKQITAFWLSKGVDGFRLDAVGHSHPDREKSIAFWHWFRKTVRSLNPNAYIVGEAWEDHNEIARYANALGSCFNFAFGGSLAHNLNEGTVRNFPFEFSKISTEMEWARHYDSIFLSNHDQDRIGHTLGADPKKMAAAASMLLTMKGNPWIYYGEELGFYSSKEKGDIEVRESLNWQKVPLKQLDETSLYNHYKNLIKCRKSSNALQHGTLKPIESPNEGLSIHLRAFYNEEVLVFINTTSERIQMEWGEDVYKVMYQSLGHRFIQGEKSITVPPGTTIVERI